MIVHSLAEVWHCHGSGVNLGNWVNAFETLEVTIGPPKVPRRWPILWLVGWKLVVDYTKAGCEEKFCRSQDCSKNRNWQKFGGRFWVFEGLWRSHQPFLRSFLDASLRVRVASSIKRIMLTTPMKPSLISIAATSIFQTSAIALTGIPEGW